MPYIIVYANNFILKTMMVQQFSGTAHIRHRLHFTVNEEVHEEPNAV
jgi:hypothetical protein